VIQTETKQYTIQDPKRTYAESIQKPCRIQAIVMQHPSKTMQEPNKHSGSNQTHTGAKQKPCSIHAKPMRAKAESKEYPRRSLQDSSTNHAGSKQKSSRFQEETVLAPVQDPS
jgi:hypothetical protein